MSKFKATVVGDIPANRLVILIEGETEEDIYIKLPSEVGNYVDFVSTGDLEDGQQVTVTISDKAVWDVEAGSDIQAGANVSADTDGRIIEHTTNPIRVGYAINSGKEGDIIKMVRHPKIVLDFLGGD